MSTFDDLKQGLSHAWQGVAEGWHEFTARAGDALTRFNPVHHADAARAEQDVVRAGSRWGVLAAELRVGDDVVEVDLECPGMGEEDFSIDVVDDLLVVRGEKHLERTRSSGRYHVMERAYGAFERALRLPVAVDENGGRASYRRGVLHVVLPRADHGRVRRIPVRSA
ncbi:MAG: Hsp20/alpha crystallin family protein [Gammaproteobacteria bacterium]|nr:Hsp20/alpha crystallin family protein [Gammaproteobacteria bacterium]